MSDQERPLILFTNDDGIESPGLWAAVKAFEGLGDLLVVPIFWYRELYIFAFQYVIFTILAILAYLEWKKILDKKTQTYLE